jgi:serine/threonine protein kinase
LTKKSADSDLDTSFAIDEKSEELACHGRLGDHPNIVNLIHSFETDAHVYIVLEFCSRGDLYEAIRTGTGPLETERVRQFMLQLVDAVAYIHSKGMYHRDIKPENIFLTQAGEMKLGDFGLATSDDWTYETTVGSDRYMSPEQYDSAGAVTLQLKLMSGPLVSAFSTFYSHAIHSPHQPSPILSSWTSPVTSNHSSMSSLQCHKTPTK